MAATSSSHTAFENVLRGWWLLVLFGIVSIVAGLIVLIWPGISIVSLA